MQNIAALSLLFLLAATVYSQSPTPTPSPEPIREEVVVVADRTGTSVADTPASVDVITRNAIETTSAATPDDIARQSVGFSTFRRTSGRSSNPTTQGVSFRGIGSSGASRAAVLFDGIPLNDPFGGWVQWERIPVIAIDQVEVLRGGASSLYGNYALSGAINIIPRSSAKKHTFSSDLFTGSQQTFGASMFDGVRLEKWAFDTTAAAFQTRGSKPIDPAARGPVDGYAGVRFTSFQTRLTRKLGTMRRSSSAQAILARFGPTARASRRIVRIFEISPPVARSSGQMAFGWNFACLAALKSTIRLSRP